MPRLLIFSGIPNDKLALTKLMAVEADAYFAAGELVSWARGLDKMGEVMQARGERVFVMPGNHESATDIQAFCEGFGFVNFHETTAEIGGGRFAGLGDSAPTPFDTPGESSEGEIPARLKTCAEWDPQVPVCP